MSHYFKSEHITFVQTQSYSDGKLRIVIEFKIVQSLSRFVWLIWKVVHWWHFCYGDLSAKRIFLNWLLWHNNITRKIKHQLVGKTTVETTSLQYNSKVISNKNLVEINCYQQRTIKLPPRHCRVGFSDLLETKIGKKENLWIF